MKILVTGGAGFIGSHACTTLAEAGHDLIIVDNLSNSRADVVDRLKALTGRDIAFREGDIRDGALLDRILADQAIEAVMHFAGLKAVGESVSRPLAYYDNNVRGTLELLGAMRRADVRTLVFSSSATVYGDPAEVPVTENSPRSATSPYARSKLFIEDTLSDLHAAEPDWRIACLRYFNPVGAHESGLIGESPQGIPNNLMPYVAQVAAGMRPYVSVFGGDYPTPDGTGVRDYIHVMDLAEGHLAALNYLGREGGLVTVNLGTGRGYSVLEVIGTFAAASTRPVPHRMVARRPGDVARYWATADLAQRLLGWQARRDLHTMCADAWRWQQTVLANAS
ncbi:UDP-glucose 4-epimerase GalE [Sulfurisoma sediminicola]|uniref:UDP-glucose 4-epimerase n=1 Tax=Sulfurisoma sediminicola TaxID=1381557 RepID=A0A497XCD5_9PROT|nr:UDP-glucose 4-epimerase GalE [Sulfurisoma sediminicola]RLJ63662.1 UDP-glucose 4-epimerase [Sulfurisoma sediminicola]